MDRDMAVYIMVLLLCWETKKMSRGKNETKGAIITSSGCRQTKDRVRSQGRPVLDQQGPLSRRPEPTWLCISNQLNLLYLRAEPFRSNPDQSARYACEQSLNSDDLAAQDKTTCILAPTSRYFRSAPWAYFTVNHHIGFQTESKWICVDKRTCMLLTYVLSAHMCFWWVNIDLHFK